MSRERLRAAVFLLLLAGLITVLATRSVRLARHPEELDGIDERKWFHPAGPVSGAASTFGAVRSRLPPRAEVWLLLPREWGPEWWDWMALYHLPEQRIAGVVLRGKPAKIPEGAWILAFRRDGSAFVVRQNPQ